jgi:hypothetical protein
MVSHELGKRRGSGLFEHLIKRRVCRKAFEEALAIRLPEITHIGTPMLGFLVLLVAMVVELLPVCHTRLLRFTEED